MARSVLSRDRRKGELHRLKMWGDDVTSTVMLSDIHESDGKPALADLRSSEGIRSNTERCLRDRVILPPLSYPDSMTTDFYKEI